MRYKRNKYMQLIEILAIKEEIKLRIESGDYVTLAKILLVKRSTAVTRFVRNKKHAVMIMQDIVTEREKTILKLKKKYLTFNQKLYTHEKSI